MNSVLCVTEGIPDTFLSFFYIDSTKATAPPYNTDKNLQNLLWPTGVYWGMDDGGSGPWPAKPTYNPFIMAWTVLYITFWMVLSWWMFTNGVFIKI
jgi:hypothetical protein